MSSLRTWYRDHLAGSLKELEKARSALEAEAGSSGAAETIRRLAHSLHGSGGTYGFPEVSDAAAAVEEAPDEDIPTLLSSLIETVRETASASKDEIPSVLVVEDDEALVHLLRDQLTARNIDVVTAGSAADANTALRRHKISLIILDLVLPDADGRHLLDAVRSHPVTASTPIIVVTVRGSSEIESECLRLGADGFLEKPFDPATLLGLVGTMLKTPPADAASAERDELTGLLNRAALSALFQAATSPDDGREGRLSVAAINVNRLRSINDTCGRDTGDRVLRHVADRLSAYLPDDVVLGRWQGDGFVAVLRDHDEAGARGAVRGALNVLRHDSVRATGDSEFTVTLSAGIAEVSAATGLDEAVRRAETQLFRAKARGVDQVVASGEEIDLATRTILLAEDDPAIVAMVQHRLRQEGFVVRHCQDGADALAVAREESISLFLLDVEMPLVDGFEVLARLRKEQRFAQVPIVMLTARGTEEDIVRGFDLGANDYIVKPVAPDEIVTRVQRLLSRWVENRLDELEDRDFYSRATDVVDTFLHADSRERELPENPAREMSRELVERLSCDVQALSGHVVSPAGAEHRGGGAARGVNLAILAVRVGQALIMDDGELEELCLAALTHTPEGASATGGHQTDTGELPARNPEETGLQAQIIAAARDYESRTHAGADEAQTPSAAMEALLGPAGEIYPRKVLKAMVDAIGVFPVGSYVELSSQEAGRVMAHRPANPMRPLVAVLVDAAGKRLEQARALDLVLNQAVHVARLLPADDERTALMSQPSHGNTADAAGRETPRAQR